MGHLSYAGALATVLVVGLTTIGLMTPGGSVERAHAGPQLVAKANAPEPVLSLQASKTPPALESPSLSTAQPGFGFVASSPRYIIDARPVSYEPSSSFNF